jgi:hypothetical protein
MNTFLFLLLFTIFIVCVIEGLLGAAILTGSILLYCVLGLLIVKEKN